MTCWNYGEKGHFRTNCTKPRKKQNQKFGYDNDSVNSAEDIGDALILSVNSCNDPFSRFEQQTSILEKLAEAMDPTMDRHGHDGPSQGLVSKHLENLKLGTENRLSELCDGMAGRTVAGTTARHRLRKSQAESDFWLSFKGRF